VKSTLGQRNCFQKSAALFRTYDAEFVHLIKPKTRAGINGRTETIAAVLLALAYQRCTEKPDWDQIWHAVRVFPERALNGDELVILPKSFVLGHLWVGLGLD
jgi:hypothetical protein